MAVNIDEFKRDLDQLKNQRSVIQAKLDEANRHVEELKGTLAGMGFQTIDQAKQAYTKQLADAEQQHALVKQLIQEIQQVDVKCPTREDVMKRLSELSVGNVHAPSEQSTPQMEQSVPQDDVIPEVINPVPDVAPVIPDQTAATVNLNNSQVVTNNNSDIDLGDLLFASL